jgi:flagellar L-ring protein precursor FlgH
MTFTAAAMLFLLMQNPGGSLFSERSPSLFLFRDFKARNVTDIVTIQINESAIASNSANTSTDKSGSVNVRAPALGGLENTNSRLDFSNVLFLSSALNFAGEGSTSRSGQLQAFVSAKVTQVFPNGDLGIEGIKEVTVNRERQILRIRGVVRPRDITPHNVVLSTSIANMEVVFDGKGIVSDANKPGFLYRLLTWVTPF